MADRMTPDQVAELRLPECCRLRALCDGHWIVDEERADNRSWAVATVAAHVANGHLPRSVYDWAWAAYEGRGVPTVEQWADAQCLARCIRHTDEHLRSGHLRDLCNRIDPPKPKPKPDPAPAPSSRPVVDLFQGSRLVKTQKKSALKMCCECRLCDAPLSHPSCIKCCGTLSKPNWEPKP